MEGGRAADVAQLREGPRPGKLRRQVALDRVCERCRGDALVRRRRESVARPDPKRVRAATVGDGRPGGGNLGDETPSGVAAGVRIIEQLRARRVMEFRLLQVECAL